MINGWLKWYWTHKEKLEYRLSVAMLASKYDIDLRIPNRVSLPTTEYRAPVEKEVSYADE